MSDITMLYSLWLGVSFSDQGVEYHFLATSIISNLNILCSHSADITLYPPDINEIYADLYRNIHFPQA